MVHFSVICTIHPVINTSEVMAPSVEPSVGFTEQLGVWNSAHPFDILVYRTWMLQTGQQELNKKGFSLPGQQVVAYLSRYDIKDDSKRRSTTTACFCMCNIQQPQSRWGYDVTVYTMRFTWRQRRGGQTAADVCCLKEKHGCK